MAETQIALLRGINVGTAKRVAMADLRALVESLGYKEVRTLLNSGNVVFTASGFTALQSASRIEKALPRRLGVSSNITVITAAELASIVKDNPLTKIAVNPSLLLVTVLTNPSDRTLIQPLLNKKWGPGAFAVGRRVAYLWCPEGSLKSELAAAVNRLLGDAATTRNWATILKLHALAVQAHRE